ncbi:MAG TPA: Hsp20/alpha crystallin family protein [Methanomassiliicoccales archaeon]|nr:Hsp20/alpha crystallin family protein [Methanomassiliicoccales archaeon]
MVRKRESEKDLVPGDYWTPMSPFDEMEKVFDDFRMGVKDFWLPSISTTGPRVPAIDIKETAEGFVVTAELPGMRKEDVEIEIVKGNLKISAMKEEVKEERKKGYLRRERGYLSFQRHLPLPENSNLDGIEAKLVDGLLQINIPKKEKSDEKRRTVEVK